MMRSGRGRSIGDVFVVVVDEGRGEERTKKKWADFFFHRGNVCQNRLVRGTHVNPNPMTNAGKIRGLKILRRRWALCGVGGA